MKTTLYTHKANGIIKITKEEKVTDGKFVLTAKIEGTVTVTTKSFNTIDKRDFSKFEL